MQFLMYLMFSLSVPRLLITENKVLWTETGVHALSIQMISADAKDTGCKAREQLGKDATPPQATHVHGCHGSRKSESFLFAKYSEVQGISF